MQTWNINVLVRTVVPQIHSSAALAPSRLSYLYLVTPCEIEDLRQALARRILPLDFEAKLSRLAEGDLLQRNVARHCCCFLALLLAAADGSFQEARPTDWERLLRVLAYVRKEDDFIADYKPNGFADDQCEVHGAAVELAPLLESFKAWRLRHQVPGMWRN